jgi:hypothetical protein
MAENYLNPIKTKAYTSRKCNKQDPNRTNVNDPQTDTA